MNFRIILSYTAALTLITSAAAPPTLRAGIPEPDLVWYGKVLDVTSGTSVRVTSGTLTWQIEPTAGGAPWTLSTPVTNINDQFSYVLRVACETPEPGVTGTVATVFLTTPATSYRRVTVTLDGQALSLVGSAGDFAPLPSDRGRTERIDLQLGTALEDSDGDGLGDAWERQFFGDLSANPDEDPDGDGMTNLQEFRAGTNPKDAQSRLEFVEISPQPGGIRVRWSSQPDHSYRIRRSPTLLAAPASYQVIQTGIAATPPTNEFLDTATAGGTQFFYIIELEE
jgi:Bacterial TSP3 repeat